MIPAEAYGVKVMSMAMLSDDDSPAILRGPDGDENTCRCSCDRWSGARWMSCWGKTVGVQSALLGPPAGHGDNPADLGARPFPLTGAGGRQHAAGCQP